MSMQEVKAPFCNGMMVILQAATIGVASSVQTCTAVSFRTLLEATESETIPSSFLYHTMLRTDIHSCSWVLAMFPRLPK